MPLEQVSENRVLSKDRKDRTGTYRALVADYKCSYCGKITEKQVSAAKRDESCGCQQRRLHSKATTKHGMTSTPTYKAWVSMKQRTTNPKNRDSKSYSGRGISVCDRWLNSFEFFLEDMGERPVGRSLDRIDNSKGYEPGNCRWADAKTQCRNRRSNRILTIDGGSRCMVEWAEQHGAAKLGAIKSRLRLGWTEKEAVFGKSKDSTNVQ